MGATMFCAQIGLEPNTPMGHVYLIPFGNKRKGVTEVQVIIGYKGFIELARRSGQMETIAAQPVYANDEFSMDYMNPDRSFHKPCMTGDRGEFIGAWAMARFKDGGMAFDFMPKADIDRIRDGSQGYQTAKRFNNTNTPWLTNYDQMARKTAVRRLSKMLPLSVEMAAAVALDERDDRRASQGMGRQMQTALEMGEFDIAAVVDDAPEDEGAGDEPPPSMPNPEQEQREGRQPSQEEIARDRAERAPPAQDVNPETGEVVEPTKPRATRQATAEKAPPPADTANLDFGA
jgi:recombination protein RecT